MKLEIVSLCPPDEIRIFSLSELRRDILFLVHEMTGVGLPLAKHDTTKVSPSTTMRTEDGNANSCGESEGGKFINIIFNLNYWQHDY